MVVVDAALEVIKAHHVLLGDKRARFFSALRPQELHMSAGSEDREENDVEVVQCPAMSHTTDCMRALEGNISNRSF